MTLHGLLTKSVVDQKTVFLSVTSVFIAAIGKSATIYCKKVTGLGGDRCLFATIWWGDIGWNEVDRLRP
ncbi:MAG TPA: hypothetical protein ENH21_01355 [Chromatiales bacterium]|nr:hypothetical protein [Chromatiales bacterium]HEX22057.1 hypothetical protein [Chromatiales bacterium]